MEHIGKFMIENPGYFTFIIVYVLYVLACTVEDICLTRKQKKDNSCLDNLSRNSAILYRNTKTIPRGKEDKSDGQ